ncbi:MAG TPA: S41 family peptidase [Pseudosphingobacterium sp.]|nr:S41 family peptidase [Pseudosphingobacterium sp.]
MKSAYTTLSFNYINFLIGASMFLFLGCKKEPELPQFPVGSDESVNTWVLENMRNYYFWNANLPGNPTIQQSPSSFFESIKNQQDRFSTLMNSKQPETFGYTLTNTFGFELMHFQTGGETQTLVSLVVPQSEAETKGLVRGQAITHINDKTISSNNIAALVEQSLQGSSIKLRIEAGGEIEIAASYIAENPVYKASILDVADRKVGYLFLNAFEFNGVYDLLQAFENFKASNINDLIVDMRYNPGGNVPFATFLATLIANVDANDIFVEYRGNRQLGNTASTFSNEFAKQPIGYAFSFEEIRSRSLGLSRVYLLTGRNTASAAELLINSLSPYIQTIQIGEQTLGKDMAAVELVDNAEPKMAPDWTLLPLVYKLYNKAGNGDYPAGLKPDLDVLEYNSLPLRPFGSEEDPLVQRAIGQMGDLNVVRKSERLTGFKNKVLYQSEKLKDRPVVIQLLKR